ncbi:MAG: type II secretion system F family protein [Limisphaerales bacterium]
MSPPIPIQFAVSGLTQYSPGEVALSLLGYLGFAVLPICLLAWLLYYLLSLPMRRQERARFFLDLLESALKQGRPVEQTLVDMASSHDPTLGVRFHLVAAYVEQGLRLRSALEKVPRFLPAQLTAMLRAGEELGDLRKVLPACRYLVKDAQSNVRGAVSYLALFAFVLSPFAIFLFNVLAIFVFPKFAEILMDMTGTRAPLFEYVRQGMGWLILGQVCLLGVLLLAALLYVGGPRLTRWLQFGDATLADRIAWQVPWKRKRMQRNFSAMLAVLLDGGVPEPDAVRLAGECAANAILHRLAARVRAALAQGVKLTEAVLLVDESGEFRWRLANAVHAHGGFLPALAGWHEALDAKAFQQEQAATHVVTSALVVANGVMVALVALAVFGALISVIEAGVLW